MDDTESSNPPPKRKKRKRGGTQCVAYGCKKRKKPKTEPRSDSEDEPDEESAIKRSLPRTFHAFPSNEERRNLWIRKMKRDDFI